MPWGTICSLECYCSQAGHRTRPALMRVHALVAPSRQGGKLARIRELKQRRPPAAPVLLAAREIARGAPCGRPVSRDVGIQE